MNAEERDQKVSACMARALELARQAAAEDEVPVGAVVMDLASGKILGEGRNQREHCHDPTGHAEILALQSASKSLQSWRLLNCVLIVTLEPCPMCLAAAQQARVEQVIYAAHDPKGGALSLGYRLHEDQRLNHRFSGERLDEPECSEVLKQFFRKKRQKPL